MTKKIFLAALALAVPLGFAATAPAEAKHMKSHHMMKGHKSMMMKKNKKMMMKKKMM